MKVSALISALASANPEERVCIELGGHLYSLDGVQIKPNEDRIYPTLGSVRLTSFMGVSDEAS